MRCVIRQIKTGKYVKTTTSTLYKTGVENSNGIPASFTNDLDKARVYRNEGMARMSIGIKTDANTGEAYNSKDFCWGSNRKVVFKLPEEYATVGVKLTLV